MFEESELVSEESEAIRKCSDKYIVPRKLVAEYVKHLAQIKWARRRRKKSLEGSEWNSWRLNQEYNDIEII